MHHRLREQVNHYENQAASILAGNLIAGLMLVFLLNPALDQSLAILWLAMHGLFNLGRFVLTLYFRRRILQTEDQINARYHFYFSMVAISGLVWGLSAFWLFPADSAEFQLLYLLVIVGFTATAMSLVNILPGAYPVLLLLIFSCVFLKLFMSTTQFSISLGVVLGTFILFMLAAAQSFRRNLVESILLRMKLQQQAIQDVLTGLHNRRYFMDQLGLEWNRCMRHQHSITIIIIDIDHFKKINDRYGHMAGDDCLVKIADLLDKTIQRTGEFVARIGGEEFAIVMPDAKPRTAVKLAEKLRNDLSLLRFSHGKHTFQVSGSMGIACTTPQVGDAYDQLFTAADQALYQAKNAGRNCYRLAGSCVEKKS